MLDKIIDPISKELLERELTDERLLRKTNKANNLLYVVDAHNSPNVMREIGRLREISFRDAGGGTGLSCDIDEFDTMECPCKQLIVWNPDACEIIGGYRYILGKDVKLDADGQPRIATSHIFRFSRRFVTDYLPNILELGRSFVVPDYQSSKQGAKSLFALDNLWDGLGALVVEHPEMKYMFGKFTMYPSFGPLGRDMILYFLRRHFGDAEQLVVPKKSLPYDNDIHLLSSKLPEMPFKDGFKLLHSELQQLGLKLPPLINAYVGLSATMKFFGTAINDVFGDVEESAIMVTVADIYEEKRERHINTYVSPHNKTEK